MRLNTSNSSLFALSSLFFLTSSLPFTPREVAAVEPLVRRATYSVVPVDGGPAAETSTNGSPAAATIVETVIETPAPTTRTVVETDTLPAVTDSVISTKTIDGQDTTQTLLVTVTPSPATVTATGYLVVDISSPTITVEVQEPAATPSSSSESTSLENSSSTPATAQSSPSGIVISATPSVVVSAAVPTLSTPTIPWASNSTISISSSSTSYSSAVSSSSAGAIISPSTSYTPIFTMSTASSVPLTASSASASNTPHDNGQWHTTYPSWSNSTRTATQVIKSADAIPTLPASAPIDIPADSVPGMRKK